jgi:inhibitor of cysteine peptidase
VSKIRSGILVLFILLVSFILASTPTALCASSSTENQNQNKVITDANNGKLITLQKGQTFSLKLAENPSTGYAWQLHLSKGLKLVSNEYVPGSSGALGASGTHVWTIKAVKNGYQQVNAVYKRPLEKTTPQDKRFKLRVIVKKGCCTSCF